MRHAHFLIARVLCSTTSLIGVFAAGRCRQQGDAVSLQMNRKVMPPILAVGFTYICLERLAKDNCLPVPKILTPKSCSPWPVPKSHFQNPIERSHFMGIPKSAFVARDKSQKAVLSRRMLHRHSSAPSSSFVPRCTCPLRPLLLSQLPSPPVRRYFWLLSQYTTGIDAAGKTV